jgi:uncharacterized protein YjbI with pentapeptide repeats
MSNNDFDTRNFSSSYSSLSKMQGYTDITKNNQIDENYLDSPVKIMLGGDLLINYMAEKNDSKLNPYVHEILRLTYLDEITCFVFEEDIDLEFGRMTGETFSHLVDKYFSEMEAKKNSLEVIGSQIKAIDLQDKVLAKIKKIISNDIILCKESEVLTVESLSGNCHNLVIKDISDSDLYFKLGLSIKDKFHEQMKFKSIVVNSHKSLTHIYDKCNAKGLNIRVDNPESFVEYYMAEFTYIPSKNTDEMNEISADDISEISKEFNQVAVLNKLIGAELVYEPFSISELEDETNTQVAALNKLIGLDPIYQPFLIKELGDGWHFIDFQVMTTKRCAVIAKIKLWNKEYDHNFIFTGTGNGVIDAILNAVDDAAKYMTEQGIIKKSLPNKSKIFSFLISDRDNDVRAKVECKIIFKENNQYYIACNYHSDTVKSVLGAYASVLAKILKDDYCEDNSWIVDNEMIQYLYSEGKGKKDFNGLKGIDLVLRGSKNSPQLKEKFKEMCFDSSQFNSIYISQDSYHSSSWYKVESGEVNLSKSCFHYTDFSETQFGAINVIDCKFNMSKMQHIKWSSATIINTEMSGTVLTNADLSHAKLYNVNLTGANLTGANLNDADFKNVNLTNAILNGTQLENVNLGEAILVGTYLASK